MITQFLANKIPVRLQALAKLGKINLADACNLCFTKNFVIKQKIN